MTTKELTKLDIVILCALGVGGSTLFGALVGLCFKRMGGGVKNIVMALSAGIMLAASILGLVLPSLEHGGRYGVFITSVGLFFGAGCVIFFDFLLSKVGEKWEISSDSDGERLHRALVFVLAIAIHNLPEGIAAGVGFGTGDTGNAIFIATSIALQNIPEGMAVIVALLDVGVKPIRTLAIASFTGLIEVFGTFIGYFAVAVSSSLLPFILAAAAGSMLYVICQEMIPDCHGEDGYATSFLFILGFAMMLVLDSFL